MLPPAPYPSGTQHPIPARAIVANPHHSSPPRRSPTSVHRSPPLFPEIPLAQPPTRRASYSASSAPTFNPNPCLPYHPYLHHPAFSSDWSSHSDSVSRRSPPAPAANDFAQQSTKLPRIRTVLGPQLGTSQFPPDRLYSRPYSFDDSSRPRSVSFPFGAGVARAGPSRSSDVHPRHRSADSSLAVYNPPGAVLLNTWPRAISPPVSEDEGEDDGEPRKRKRRRLASEAPRDAHLRKFPCQYCGKRFARPSALETHIRSHTKVSPYTCPDPTCPKVFTVESNRRRHCRLLSHAAPSVPAETAASITSPSPEASDSETSVEKSSKKGSIQSLLLDDSSSGEDGQVQHQF